MTAWMADDVAPARPCSSNSTATPPSARSSASASDHPSVGQRGIDVVGGDGEGQRAREQLQVRAGQRHRSVPRSSRRRAMMLRWISALPP